MTAPLIHSSNTPAPGSGGLGTFWTIPNVLTLSRLALVAPVAYLIMTRGSLAWLLALSLAAVATDWLDGRVARWSRTVSNWGKVLDPVVDKTGAGFIVLALYLRGSLPGWFLGLIVARDVSIVLAGIHLRRKTGHIAVSIWSGKVAVTAVAITALAAFLDADAPIMQFCLYTTSALLVYSGLRYAARYLRLVKTGGRWEEPGAESKAEEADTVAEPNHADMSA